MRQSMRIISAGAILFGFAYVGSAADQLSPQQIVENAIKATGGVKGFQRATMTWNTKGDYYGTGEAVPFTASYALQLPHKYRFEIANFVTFVVDGNQGWMKQNGETTALTPAQLDEAKEQLYLEHLTLLHPLKTKDYTISNKGESKLGGHTVVGIQVTHPKHRPATLFFDTKTFRLIAIDSLARSEEKGGELVSQTTIYSAYKDIGGVPYPMKIQITRGGMKYVDGQNSDVKFMKEIPAKVFAKP